MALVDSLKNRLDYRKQPKFEKGDKTLFSIALRRGIRASGLAPYLGVATDALYGGRLSSEVVDLKDKLGKNIEHPEAKRLVLANTLSFPDQLFLRASPWHLDNWMRDSFMTAWAINNPDVEAHLLKQFTQYTAPDGQLPTNRFIGSNRRCLFDDESTMLGIIWRDRIAQMANERLHYTEVEDWTKRLNWVKQHVVDGQYVTSAGTEKSWFDTYKFNKDVITYNQGIYAAMMIAAHRIHLDVKVSEITDAKQGLKKLIHPSGRLQFTDTHEGTDVSSLFGEYIAMTQLEETIVGPKVVRDTVEQFIPDEPGFRIVTNADGSFLDPREFNSPWAPGDYHNGAEWPFYSSIAQAVYEMHTYKEDAPFWNRMFGNLKDSQNAEYINSNVPEFSPVVYNAKRANHAINAVIYAIKPEHA